MKKRYSIIIIILLIILLGGGVWFGLERNKKEEIKKQEVVKQEEIKTDPKEISEIDTSDWQTYRNEELGFEIKIPKSWKVEEKILNKSQTQNIPVPLVYVSKELEDGLMDRIDFYSIIFNAPFGYISVNPYTSVINNKFIDSITCKNESKKPCFDDLDKISIDNKDAYKKKYNENTFSIVMKDLPKNWKSFNELAFVDYDVQNQNSKNIKIFEEVLKSINFLD